MKYYRVFHSTKPEEVGCFPQVSDGLIPTTVDDPMFIGNRLMEPITGPILVPAGKLNRKAKLTDLVSASFPGLSSGLYLSSAVKEVVDQFHTSGIQFFQTMLLNKDGEELDYYIAYPGEISYSKIDFSNSVFFKTRLSKKEDEVKINSYKDFQKTKDSLSFPFNIVAEKISILDNPESDFFALYHVKYGGIGYYLSEKLKDAIERSRLTGMVFTGINDSYP